MRWSHVKLVKAAVAFWHVVRWKRAIFDDEWPPRVGAFWCGIKRWCVRATLGEMPLWLAPKRAVRIHGESALARWQ